MVNITQSKNPIDSSKIDELEKLTGLIFPKEYKNFLLRFNGGKCHPNVFVFIQDGKENSSDVNWLYAICEETCPSLAWNIEVLKLEEKRVPSHILPIGDDSGGNAICISCGTNDYGKIYFWDHESEVDYSISDDSDYSNLYWIANSFDEFLENLIGEEDII